MSTAGLYVRDPLVSGIFLYALPDAEFAIPQDHWIRRDGTHFGAMFASDLAHTQARMQGTFQGPTDSHTLHVDDAHMADLVDVRMWVYNTTYVAISLTVRVSGNVEPARIATIANALVDDRARIVSRTRTESAASSFAARVLSDALHIFSAQYVAIQRFTHIDLREVTQRPAGPLAGFPTKLQRDYLTLVIRRQTSFDEFRLETLVVKYDSQSMYVDDYVCATPHNLFSYVPQDRDHISPEFYLGRYISWRVLSAVLLHNDKRTMATMDQLRGRRLSLTRLRRISNASGRRAIDVELWRESFEHIPQSIAARAKNFDVHVRSMLEIDELFSGIEGRLNLLEQVVTTRYSLAVQVLLQRVSIGLSAVALAVAVIALLEAKP